MDSERFFGMAVIEPMNDHSPHPREPTMSMDTVESRIASFTNWPHGGRLRPIFMAGAGFYQHSVDTDAVSCFNCQVIMEGWNEHSDPITEHRRASPNCTWNNDTYMTTWDERFHSFHTWPLDIKPLPATMASAGFFHSNKDTDAVTCFSCKISLKDWKKQDDPIQHHIQLSSIFRPCAWIAKVTNQPALYIPPSPPATPPLPPPAAIPHKCEACQKTFPSLNSFHRHRKQIHKNARKRIGIPLKKPAVVFMGKYRVSKSTKQRMNRGRRGNTDLFGRDT